MSARTIQETDAGDRKIELVGRAEGDPEFYVDGVHGVQVTGPIVKINLYTLGIETSPTFQRRESVCRLVMSTPQMLQMADFMTQLAAGMRQVPANPPPADPGPAKK